MGIVKTVTTMTRNMKIIVMDTMMTMTRVLIRMTWVLIRMTKVLIRMTRDIEPYPSYYLVLFSFRFLCFLLYVCYPVRYTEFSLLFLPMFSTTRVFHVFV